MPGKMRSIDNAAQVYDLLTTGALCQPEKNSGSLLLCSFKRRPEVVAQKSSIPGM
jgi:hypothetical protein